MSASPTPVPPTAQVAVAVGVGAPSAGRASHPQQHHQYQEYQARQPQQLQHQPPSRLPVQPQAQSGSNAPPSHCNHVEAGERSEVVGQQVEGGAHQRDQSGRLLQNFWQYQTTAGLVKPTDGLGKPYAIEEINSALSTQDSQLGQHVSMCEVNAKKRMNSAMADDANPVDTGQPMTLDELDADEDAHVEQISDNTLPTEEHRARQFLPNGGPEVIRAALDSEMKDIQCREIEAMCTQEVRSLAANIAKRPDEHSTTVMLATAIRALGVTMPKEEPQLQRQQQPPTPRQEQDIGDDTLNGSGRQGIERPPELAHGECQNGFSGFDELTDRTDELRAEQHRLDEQAYIKRGGCKGCHGSKYSEETGFCKDCLYCTS